MLHTSKGNSRNVRQLLSDFAQSEPRAILSSEVQRLIRAQAVTQLLYRAARHQA
jgi:hypothetical protein